MKEIGSQELMKKWNEMPINDVVAAEYALIIILIGLVLSSLINSKKNSHDPLFAIFIFLGLAFFGYHSLDVDGRNAQYSEWSKQVENYVDKLPTKTSDFIVEDGVRYDLTSPNVKISIDKKNADTVVISKLDKNGNSISKVKFKKAEYVEDLGLDEPFVSYKEIKQPLGDKYPEGKIKVEFHIPLK